MKSETGKPISITNTEKDAKSRQNISFTKLVAKNNIKNLCNITGVIVLSVKAHLNGHKDILGTFISDLVLQVLSFVAHQERENIKQRQKEGIVSAKNRGIKFGRPKLELNSEDFKSIYKQWKDERITGVEATQLLKMTKATFYRRAFECLKLICSIYKIISWYILI